MYTCTSKDTNTVPTKRTRNGGVGTVVVMGTIPHIFRGTCVIIVGGGGYGNPSAAIEERGQRKTTKRHCKYQVPYYYYQAYREKYFTSFVPVLVMSTRGNDISIDSSLSFYAISFRIRA